MLMLPLDSILTSGGDGGAIDVWFGTVVEPGTSL